MVGDKAGVVGVVLGLGRGVRGERPGRCVLSISGRAGQQDLRVRCLSGTDEGLSSAT